MKYGLVNTIDTGHTQNIFDVALLPQDPARLLSVAGDKTVRLYDLNTASETIQQPGHSLWNHHTSACVRVLRCHSSRVKKIETESSNLFLTCSEDGTVRQHDLRNSHTCGGSGCGPPLIRYDRMKIYSISISKARPHLLVLAGSSR